MQPSSYQTLTSGMIHATQMFYNRCRLHVYQQAVLYLRLAVRMIGTKLYRSDNIPDVLYRDVPKKQKGHFSIEQNAIENMTAGSLVD